MAIQLSVTAIWGIGAGGAVFVILAILGVVFFWLRRKHKALLTTINRDTERPRAHLSITDEDVMRMPGTRRVRPSPYNQRSGWIPVSSRENVAKRRFAPNPADIDPTTGLPPWPVRFPRNLKKTQSSPVVRVPLAALSPITERSTNNTATSPNLSKIANGDAGNQEESTNGILEGGERLDGGPDPDLSPYQLKPRPLFHGQQRSFSHGTLTGLSEDSKSKVSAHIVSESAENRGMKVARMRRSASLCSQQPGQAPTIPIPPLPFQLAANRRSRRVQVQPHTSPQRISGMSLLSGDTSLLDEMTLRRFSQADTDFTSISLTSPPESTSTNIGLGISDGSQSKWNFSTVDRAARPQLSQQHSFRASIHNSLPRSASSGLSMSLLDHNSPNAKILPSATKSTLVIPGKVARGPSQRRKIPQGSPLNTMNVFKVSEEMNPKRASTSILQVVSGNQGSPAKNPWTDRPTSIATEDPFRWDPKTSMQPGKPSAMKKATRQRHKRQSCVRISNIPLVIPSNYPPPFQPNRQPSISPLTSPLPSLFLNQKHPPHGVHPSSSTTARPPSTSTFNPQLPKGIRSSTTTTKTTSTSENNAYSPTFSMIPLYEPPSPTSSSSTSTTASLASTPTHNPSLSRPAQNPNRHRAIFPSTHGSHWPPLLSSSITPSDPPTNFAGPDLCTKHESQAVTPTSATAGRGSRPTSFLFSFPDPPLLPPARDPSHTLLSHNHPSNIPPPTHNRRSSSPKRISPIRGPRPFPSPTRQAPSTSPTRSRIQKPSSPSPRSPRTRPSRGTSPAKSPSLTRHSRHSTAPQKLDLLRISIMELRRMNSEAQGWEGKREGKGHGRYLDLGDGDGDVVEDGEGNDVEGKGGREGESGRRKVRGPREMRTPRKGDGGVGVGGREGKGKETPGSLYDAGGFLVD
ncbi:MAG: hypothetical protein LQ343_002972 [Gyalolechia ehrenbergii]|nr:MAG: hypothetical protein LQ343_002972 [Gyalolechia ehrenbergii]